MNILIPGGAGYIGSHMVKYAQEQGHNVVVFDNFSTGHEWAVKDCEVINLDLLDVSSLAKALKGRHFDGVIHFAAKSLVGESINRPDYYYRNNVIGTLNLIHEMIKNDINNIVFSSTAAIFGNPVEDKITEDHQKKPINPYGHSKLMVESILRDICNSYNFNAICLRYFNAAGAHHSGDIGEAHNPETHLIPNVINSVLKEKSDLSIFGDKFNTKDGTCIRDYVHITDLASAHLHGLNYMSKNNGFDVFNLGNGDGFSVLEVIKTCERLLNTKIKYSITNPRKGDPAILVADSLKAKQILNWSPRYRNLDEIIASAIRWHKNNKYI